MSAAPHLFCLLSVDLHLCLISLSVPPLIHPIFCLLISLTLFLLASLWVLHICSLLDDYYIALSLLITLWVPFLIYCICICCLLTSFWLCLWLPACKCCVLFILFAAYWLLSLCFYRVHPMVLNLSATGCKCHPLFISVTACWLLSLSCCLIHPSHYLLTSIILIYLISLLTFLNLNCCLTSLWVLSLIYSPAVCWPLSNSVSACQIVSAAFSLSHLLADHSLTLTLLIRLWVPLSIHFIQFLTLSGTVCQDVSAGPC